MSFISSTVGKLATPSNIAYQAVKGAIPHITRGLARVFAPVRFVAALHTALHVAARQGAEPIVAILLENKAGLTIRDQKCKQPLQASSETKRHAVGGLLRDSGAKD